jgi:hypothetical protein
MLRALLLPEAAVGQKVSKMFGIEDKEKALVSGQKGHLVVRNLQIH